MGFDVKPHLGVVEMVWVTAKQSNNKARGRAAHPGSTRSTTVPTLRRENEVRREKGHSTCSGG